jgi:hypothetical protein
VEDAVKVVFDMEYALMQILQAEAGEPSLNVHDLAIGLREVLGIDENSVLGQAFSGTADQLFPRAADPLFQNADDSTFYAQVSGTVFDSDPRTISNLVADQAANSSAAIDAQAEALDALGAGYQAAFNPATPPDVDAAGKLFISNVTLDNGLLAPFNGIAAQTGTSKRQTKARSVKAIRLQQSARTTRSARGHDFINDMSHSAMLLSVNGVGANAIYDHPHPDPLTVAGFETSLVVPID